MMNDSGVVDSSGVGDGRWCVVVLLVVLVV